MARSSHESQRHNSKGISRHLPSPFGLFALAPRVHLCGRNAEDPPNGTHYMPHKEAPACPSHASQEKQFNVQFRTSTAPRPPQLLLHYPVHLCGTISTAVPLKKHPSHPCLVFRFGRFQSRAVRTLGNAPHSVRYTFLLHRNVPHNSLPATSIYLPTHFSPCFISKTATIFVMKPSTTSYLRISFTLSIYRATCTLGSASSKIQTKAPNTQMRFAPPRTVTLQ